MRKRRRLFFCHGSASRGMTRAWPLLNSAPFVRRREILSCSKHRATSSAQFNVPFSIFFRRSS